MEISVGEDRAYELRAREVHSSEVGTNEDRAYEIRLHKVRVGELGIAEIRVSEGHAEIFTGRANAADLHIGLVGAELLDRPAIEVSDLASARSVQRA